MSNIDINKSPRAYSSAQCIVVTNKGGTAYISRGDSSVVNVNAENKISISKRIPFGDRIRKRVTTENSKGEAIGKELK